MWQNLLNFIKYFLLLQQIIFLFANAEVSAASNVCSGKHRSNTNLKTNLQYQQLEPIEYIGFDKVPSETAIKNNGQFLRIDLKYDDDVPMIKINFETTLAVKGTYRLKFLYFQWLEQLADGFSFANFSFPVEIHAVFYDVEATSFEQAVNFNKSVVILAYKIEMDRLLQTDGYDILLQNLELVRESAIRTTIENRNLRYWVKPGMQRFYAYEGSFLQFNCDSSVIWIDFVDILSIKPEVAEELSKLKANEVTLLMDDIPAFVRPQGKVYQNLLSPVTFGSAPAPAVLFPEIEEKLDRNSGVERAAQFKIIPLAFWLMMAIYLFLN